MHQIKKLVMPKVNGLGFLRENIWINCPRKLLHKAFDVGKIAHRTIMHSNRRSDECQMKGAILSCLLLDVSETIVHSKQV